MNDSHVNRYAAIADKLERDPYGPDGGGRATVVNGRGFRRWQRFHPGAEVVWIELDGKMIGLTPWQARVYDLARTMIDTGPITMRQLAQKLGCAPSTVSRALVKLMAWGLIGYLTARGRYAGSILFRMHKGDGLDRFRQAAKAKVREWSKAAERRISRLRANVAPYLYEDRGRDTLTDWYRSTDTVMDATLKLAWTPEELREAGII